MTWILSFRFEVRLKDRGSNAIRKQVLSGFYSILFLHLTTTASLYNFNALVSKIVEILTKYIIFHIIFFILHSIVFVNMCLICFLFSFTEETISYKFNNVKSG